MEPEKHLNQAQPEETTEETSGVHSYLQRCVKQITKVSILKLFLFGVLAFIFYLLVKEVDSNTLFRYAEGWLWASITLGSVLYIVLLAKNRAVWEWDSYWLGCILSLISSAIINILIIYVIEIANYSIPTDNPYYSESAMVLDKMDFDSPKYPYFYFAFVKLKFESEELGTQTLINIDEDFCKQITVGDEYIFTLQNGFFNIPVIRDGDNEKAILR